MTYRKLQRISTHALFSHDVPLCPNVLCLHYDQIDLDYDWRTESYRCRECGFITSVTEVLFLQKSYERSKLATKESLAVNRQRKETKAQYYERVQRMERDYNLRHLSSIAGSTG